MIKALKAIAHSIFSYPSCLYWFASLFPIMSYLISYSSLSREIIYGNFPTTFDIFTSDMTHRHLVFVIWSSLILLLSLTYYLQKYYKMSHKNSSSETKARLNIYILLFAVSSILYTIFFYLAVNIDVNVRPILHAACFIAFFITHPFIHLIPKSIVRLKHRTRCLHGYTLLSLSSMATLIGSPLFLYCRINGYDSGFCNSFSGFLFSTAYLMNGLSYIFDAMTVLGHRFIRFYLYFPPPPKPISRRRYSATIV